MNRRTVLRAVGAGVIIGVAGCSGSGDGSGGDGGDSDGGSSSGGTETGTSTPTNTAEPTETASPTPTQTPESQFSTEGDDSTLIEKPASELVLTDSDINDYSTPDMSGERGDSNESAYRNFEQDGESAFRVDVWSLAGISEAEARYNNVTVERIFGASPNNLQQRQLDIAVESELATGNIDETHTRLIKFRDANAVGSVVWSKTGSPVSLQKIGEVAVVMHQKWR